MNRISSKLLFYCWVIIASILTTYWWFNSIHAIPFSEFLWSQYNQSLGGQKPGIASDLEFLTVIVGAAFNPGAGAKKILIKFGKKALKHWFKHATAKDLMNIKIYEVVRLALENGFISKLIMYSNGTAKNEVLNSGFVIYAKSKYIKMIWG